MVSGGGYEVDPEVLDTYAGGLDDRASRVSAEADQVRHVNGGDINAFGVAVGQVLGIPTRIALGVLADQVRSAAEACTSEAKNVRSAAEAYRGTDAAHADTLKTEGDL
ncbi:hypothetical protein GCM10027445_24600 [Amycolatopsis endophytica]|uniref:ESX-1 secretion-associated protein n=1 Tax=Amycolatopsis endophytica TaxID=860233 RepID=A0A853BCR6_9PSEU|nr:hypothetical protein [Amycolatopsis endophytica]NYI92447.1 hypothetical protein [Amycolatopsis endophytica]